MKNRVKNITMAKFNKTYLVYFIETVTWNLLIPIDTSVMEPQN